MKKSITKAITITCLLFGTTVFPAALSGVYTIGGASPNYATFNLAVADLLANGVSGPVVFNVRTGTYTEQILLTAVPGATATNSIIFQSETGNSSDVNLQFSNTSGNNYVVRLNAASYITIKNMTISSIEPTLNYGVVIDLINRSNNISICGNVLNGLSVSAWAATDVIQAINFSGKNLLIFNNSINNGAEGICLYGTDNGVNIIDSATVRNNTVSNFFGWGITANYQKNSLIESNTFTTITNPNYGAISIYIQNIIYPIKVRKNKIIMSGTNTGIAAMYIVNNHPSGAANGSLIADNFISVQNTNGFYLINNDYFQFYNNSVLSRTAGNTCFNVYGSSTGNELLNNIFYNSGGGAAITAGPPYVTSTNYNDFYSTGGTLGSWNGTNCANLGAWQTACGMDANSFSVLPPFTSTSDLHLTSYPALQNGTPLASVPDDIDNTTRSLVTPEIGADEPGAPVIANCCSCNNQPVITATVVATNTSCSSVCNGTATATPAGGTAPYTYHWSPSGGTTASTSGLCAGNYTVTITDAASLVVTYSVVVGQPAPVAVNMVSTPEICTQSNGTATANASGGTSPYTYSWNNGQTKQTATGLTAGNYTVTVTDHNGCVPAVGTVTVAASSALAITTSKNVSVCPGSSSILSVGGGTAYLWSTGATGNTITVNPLITTTYTIAASGGSCVKDTGITVTIRSLPVITITGNSSVCSGSATTLTASGGAKYLWNNGTTTNTITVNPVSAASYSVQVTNLYGCVSSSAIAISVVQIVATANSQTICSGNSARLSASGGVDYLWSTGETAQSILVNPLATTNYTVSVSNGSCTGNAIAQVNVNPLPNANICCNATITSGQKTTLSVGPINSGSIISWSPVSGLTCNTCQVTQASPSASTWYYAAITDINGCSRIDSAWVIVKPKCGDIFVPTAFSPNDDNQNDVLYLKMLSDDCVLSLSFKIYDRWGNSVFLTTNIATGWDGKLLGRELNSDVFVYSLQAKLTDGTSIDKKGNISLIR